MDTGGHTIANSFFEKTSNHVTSVTEASCKSRLNRGEGEIMFKFVPNFVQAKEFYSYKTMRNKVVQSLIMTVNSGNAFLEWVVLPDDFRLGARILIIEIHAALWKTET